MEAEPWRQLVASPANVTSLAVSSAVFTSSPLSASSCPIHRYKSNKTNISIVTYHPVAVGYCRAPGVYRTVISPRRYGC